MTSLDDLVLFCLDTLSPCDINFIRDHHSVVDKSSIEERLNNPDYWSNVGSFKKMPLFLFEIIFIKDGHWISRSLMILTSNKLIPLTCSQSKCIHEFSVPQVKLQCLKESSHGLNSAELANFVSKNCKKEHLSAFNKSEREMEKLLMEAKLNFREFNVHSQTERSNDFNQNDPIIVDVSGDIHMNAQHQQTLKNIVSAIGKNKWEDATHLLMEHHDNIVDFDAEDTEIYKRMAAYYRLHLDEDLHLRDFSSDEEKWVVILHKMWKDLIKGEGLWLHIARHMPGRHAGQIKQRFLRISNNDQDMTGKGGYAMALSIFPKTSSGMEATTKLQKEVRFLLIGTQEEVHLVPCKYSALRCNHMALQQEKFTYDPIRASDQFVTFVQLTFANSLKRAGLINSDSFHFTEIVYRGEDIHDIMARVERERFLVPREVFMKLNKHQVSFSNPRKEQRKRKERT